MDSSFGERCGNPGLVEQARPLLRRTLHVSLLFGLVLNLVQLGIPIYTMQVFDRVIPTGHLATLAALTLLLGAVTFCSLFVDSSRGLLLAGCSHRFGEIFDEPVAQYTLMERKGGVTLSDVDKVRAFITGPALPALLDLPWTAVYLVTLFLINIAIGIYAVACMLALLGLAVLGRHLVVTREAALSRASSRFSMQLMSISHQSALLLAMGMLPGMMSKLLEARSGTLTAQHSFSDRVVWIDSLAKMTRSAMQLGILALAAVLVVYQEVNAGAIVASSMIFTKAVAPIERLNSGISVLQSTMSAWRRLVQSSQPIVSLQARVVMPPITGQLMMNNVSLIPPGSTRSIVDQFTCEISPGKLYVIAGVEGAGKSSLARIMCGAELPTRGTVTLDGMAINKYSIAQLSREIGYLPQRSVVRSMSVMQFICRGESGKQSDAFEAACLTGADPIIRRLPEGYQTILSSDSSSISAGELRRIALASAIYRAPRLLVLDEPMLDMDERGEHDVVELLRTFRDRNTALVVISKSVKLAHLADELIVLERGRVGFKTSGQALRERLAPRIIAS